MSRPVSGPGVAAARAVAGEAAVRVERVSLVGTPYRFGGTTPQSGFDCSGLVAYVMGLQAVPLPRSVPEQYRRGRAVSRNRLKPGDLVFFTTTGRGATHVGIVTDAAQAEFVHAPVGRVARAGGCSTGLLEPALDRRRGECSTFRPGPETRVLIANVPRPWSPGL